MDTDASGLLADLVHWRGELPGLLQAVRECQAPAPVVLDRGHVAAVLERAIAGLITPHQLATWAQAVHLEDEVGIEETHEDLLSQFLFEVSTPELFAPVTTATCERWLHIMRTSDTGAGRG
ncbi:hypothetical protein [Streptomyces sclerotialus]|uniref:hypothetical protein n=1 Tax=Streptomyces sclerotialus TaxID=1957 RepID=UPI000D13ECDC